ncbi:hypothetical protein K435DRAFT_812756 [Dendrothele bispora CBS 962.96]|uniref:Uncharacterized protein n=1 Tax=Dendrothele bispora (strain CBS 962.96) TaxID=1314807 RepID=A0A4S8KNK7_DENBC|nr:hypothetical protein K435DRAFT_812756 [Dendrothele bispora CBS 962.96]
MSFDGNIAWTRCKSVVARSLDECSVDSWVFYESLINQKIVFGRINEILTNDSGKASIVLMEQFEVSSRKDVFFDLPYVFCRQDEVTFVIVPSSRNAQTAVSGNFTKSERNRAKWNLSLSTDPMTAPSLFFTNRKSQHDKQADNLQTVLGQKNKETQKKKEDTKRKKEGSKTQQESVSGTVLGDADPTQRPKKRAKLAESSIQGDESIPEPSRPRPKPRMRPKPMVPSVE